MDQEKVKVAIERFKAAGNGGSITDKVNAMYDFIAATLPTEEPAKPAEEPAKPAAE